MSITPLRRFLQAEAGAIVVEWTVLAAAVVGLGIGSVVAVRTGVISLGGETSSAMNLSGGSAPPIIGGDVVIIPGGGGDILVGGDTRGGGGDVLTGDTRSGDTVSPVIRMSGSYVPLATSPDQYATVLYEMTGLSEPELNDLFIRYLSEAASLYDSDRYAAAQYIDIAGAAYSTMVDYRYEIPRTEISIEDLYAMLSSGR